MVRQFISDMSSLMYQHAKSMFYIMTKKNWICVKLLVEDILTHILLTLLTFIVLPILQKKKKKKSIHCRRFLFGINNDANFPFTSAINELQQ